MISENWKTKKTLKIAILGEGSVGKTTISKKYSEDLSETEKITMTKGVDIAVKNLIHKSTPIALQIWDFAGQKQFRFMIDIFLRGVKGIVYVYDVNDIETLYLLYEFVEIVRNYFKENNISQVPEVLVGNKIDIGDAEVSIEDIYSFMNTHNIEKHFLVSGMYGDNVYPLFDYLIEKIVFDESKEHISTINQYSLK
ncbi:MAG: GTP-binding protein [Candidatus Heimdallarchaeum aukensis]|uniref:GTP-binding protein n=1 Tax=Candidatus Heimdallarchaeum aukensis TaxID=2876573 RepID=A0A9Y1BIX9_9ARCH|nr:MAG: GTP-binding protein [Candidatus Heimdallarchaeum aukensis]